MQRRPAQSTAAQTTSAGEKELDIGGSDKPAVIRRFQHRKKLTAQLIHENSYQHIDSKEMLSGKADNYDLWIQKFCARKYNSDFACEMSRSVKTFLNTLGKNSKN